MTLLKIFFGPVAATPSSFPCQNSFHRTVLTNLCHLAAIRDLFTAFGLGTKFRPRERRLSWAGERGKVEQLVTRLLCCSFLSLASLSLLNLFLGMKWRPRLAGVEVGEGGGGIHLLK